MTKMQHFLHVSKKDFKKVAWIINRVPIYGYKIKYDNEKENISAEFCIYNEKFKDVILKEHNKIHFLPIHITILLHILKFLYYQFPILDKKTFTIYKRFIFNKLLFKNDAMFLVLD